MMTSINHDCDTAVELHRVLTASISRRYGMAEVAASSMADLIASELRRECGGRELYVPAINRDLRDTQIRREFNGQNIDEMCKRYQLSRSSIYRIAGDKTVPSYG